MQSGDTNQGIEAFEKAVKLAPNDKNLVVMCCSSSEVHAVTCCYV